MYSITQTSDGFLWLVSLPGDIYRFDGVRFVPRQLRNGYTGKVFADPAKGLWVVADELVHLKDGVVTFHSKLDGLHGFQSMSADSDGSLWVGLRAGDAPLCNVSDRGIKCFDKNDGIPISNIHSLLADGTGGLWLGGPNALVHWRQGRALEQYPTKAMVWGLARAPDGTIWVGLGEGGGLHRLKDGVLKPFVTPAFDGSKLAVTALIVDRDGNLWVTTDTKGVFRIDGDTAEHYGHTDGLSGDSAWALFEDREGIVWVGTTSGIDSFRDPHVVTFSSEQGLGKDLAAGITASRDGSIWVANAGSLDRIQNGNVSSIRRRDGLPGDQVAAMLEDRAGNLWVGVDDGLYLFKNARFRRIGAPDQQPLGMVVGITEDFDGNIWAECASKPSKLVRIRDFQVREVFPISQIPPGHNLAADPRGGIWIVSSKGELLLLRNGIVETKVPLDPREGPLNRHIVVEPDGSILVGTEKALLGLRNGRVQRMTAKNGLPCDFVISFVQSKEKRWWLYTRCGVVELSDADLQRWWTDPDTIIQTRVYDAFDGAQPNIGSFNAAATTPDGRVWFSSGVAVQVVDPSQLSATPAAASAYIESVIVDRKESPAHDGLQVAPHPRDLQIDYTSPTFLVPQQVRFRYRLEGYDHAWHDAGTRRQAFYTDLPPGQYTFRVMAANNDGIWNEREATLSFTITPAYYQTNWFRALCAMTLLALLWAAYKLRIRRWQHQFEMTLDARVAERTRIARELHDTLLQSAHGMLLRFQTVSQLLPDRPIEAKDRLDGAIEQTAAFITEARDQVQGLRDSTIQGNDLALAISTLGEELAANPNNHRPLFRVAVEGVTRELHPIVRDEIYKIAAEALRNAFLHSGGRQVEVEIRYDDEQFRLRLRDDGVGIDAAVLSQEGREGHYGLHGMRERATLIEGKLTIWSEVDAGTEVELSVPAAKAYTSARKGPWWARKFAAKA